MNERISQGPNNQNFQNNSPWQKLGDLPFAGAPAQTLNSPKTTDLNRVAERRETPATNERQQRKIVAAMLNYGDTKDVIKAHDVQLRVGDHERVIDDMASGRINQAQERALVAAVGDPLHMIGPNRLFDRAIEGQRQPKRILAYATGVRNEDFNTVNSGNLEAFFERYPLPSDFETVSSNFLENIKANNSPRKYQEYLTVMDNFKHAMYGKRQEYWDQIKLMHNEAERRASSPKTTKLTPSDRTTRIKINGLGGERVNNEPTPRKPEQIDKAERYEWLRRTQVEGDAWERNNGAERWRLSPNMLETVGLGPEYKTKVDNTEIAFSKAFKVNQRDAMIGYVKDDEGKVHARGYYRSGSQGLWRYLPDYVSDPESGAITYFGKGGFGSAEESVTLPWELQRDLSAVADSPDGRNELKNTNPAFFLAGTAVHYNSRSAMSAAHSHGNARGSFYNEVARQPIVEFSKLQSKGKLLPQDLRILGLEAPNFARRVANFKMELSTAGEVSTSCIPSQDGKLDYMFCQDGAGRAWLGSIQTHAKVTSTGCRSEWVSAGDYATPLYDYFSQAAGYGDLNDTRGNYVGMWYAYLQEAPLIQDFVRSNQALRYNPNN